MAEVGSFQSFQVCAIRVTRLSATGVPLSGVTDGYISKAPVQVKMIPDNRAGVELMAENGCGFLAAYYKAPDQLKKYNVNFELTDLDHELIEILTDQPVVTIGGSTVGGLSKRVGACSSVLRKGVAVEFWSKKWNACAPPTGDQYWHWVWPHAYLQTAEQDMLNDFMKITVDGYLQENPNYLFGSWTTAPWPTAAGGLQNLWGVVSEPNLPSANVLGGGNIGYTQPA